MTVVDSSGWFDYFTDGPLAAEFSGHVLGRDVLVPTIVIYEVYKLMKRRFSGAAAMAGAAQMKTATVIDLHADLAAEAADVSLRYGLAMADAIVYATAQRYQADLVTSDAHFKGLPGVTYIAKQ